MQRRRAPERFLATVLFTDIADSTRLAVERGDRDWRGVLERHYQIVRTQLRRFGGREIDSAGDGFFATFDTPARAVACALEIVDATAELGIQLRAGVHTGEVEEMGPKGRRDRRAHRGSDPRRRAAGRGVGLVDDPGSRGRGRDGIRGAR